MAFNVAQTFFALQHGHGHATRVAGSATEEEVEINASKFLHFFIGSSKKFSRNSKKTSLFAVFLQEIMKPCKH